MQGARIHRAGDIRVVAFDPPTIEAAAAALERRSALTLSVVDAQLFLGVGDGQWTLPLVVAARWTEPAVPARRTCDVTTCLRDSAGDNAAVLPYAHRSLARHPGRPESSWSTRRARLRSRLSVGGLMAGCSSGGGDGHADGADAAGRLAGPAGGAPPPPPRPSR